MLEDKPPTKDFIGAQRPQRKRLLPTKDCVDAVHAKRERHQHERAREREHALEGSKKITNS